MPNIQGQKKWSEIRLLETHELARGGINGNLNEQAIALADRTEFLNQEKANKSEIVQGVFEFATYAEFNSTKANLPLNCTVVIGEENTTGTGTWGVGNNRWNGSTLTKSSFDPVEQAKLYPNSNPLFKSKSLTNTDDLNNILTAGYYTAFGNGNTPSLEKHYPTTRPGHLRMDWVATGSTGTIGFQWYQSDLGEIYWRNTNTIGSAWLAWQQILKKSDLDSTAMVKTIADGTDLNTLKVRGQYDISQAKASTFLNLPPQMIEQENANGGGTLTVIKNPNTYITHQYFDGYAEFGSYFRSMLGNGTWTPWIQLGRKVTKYNYKDLNNLLTVGIHSCATNVLDIYTHNYPAADQFLVEVMVTGNIYRQVAYQRANNTIWTRSYWGSNGWQPWVKIASQSDLDLLNSKIDANAAKIDTARASLILVEAIRADMANPLKPTRIKLIGDSITWGMGSSAGSPIEPRYGDLSDVRNTIDTSVSKTWANLLRSWIAKVYGDGTVTSDSAGSGYTVVPSYTKWSEIYKDVKMTAKDGSISSEASKLSFISYAGVAQFNGSSMNLLGLNYNSLRPVEMEFTVTSDHAYICYSKHAIGNVGDSIDVYVDDVFHSNFVYYDAVTDHNAQYKVNFNTFGTHKVKIRNVSTGTLSYAVIWGLRVDKRIYVVNDGIIGSTTKSWLDKNLFDASVTSADDFVFMMLGTNDRAAIGGPDGYYKRLGECLAKIKALAPRSHVIIMSSTFAANENTGTYKFNMRDVDSLSRKFAFANNLKFISHYTYCAQKLLDAESIWSDGLHLNDTGNRLYFENIINNLFNN
ncbi:hypothetical protein F909_00239 [Acinetobacter sp. ANC 3929]|uniref:GDSL-type esterase/lipase family protein n=1 Tax=Acinetobacter sp. ANC 3929 TaxID=1217707 RepID=UPI0002D0C1C6|nr:GDSL-type esterase/lipase family protein [Acinetobacter sp. ANC 3929]ENW84332.1 hypothetical protein F909_00239 [Acinetobacter sp. ANC 3929]